MGTGIRCTSSVMTVILWTVVPSSLVMERQGTGRGMPRYVPPPPPPSPPPQRRLKVSPTPPPSLSSFCLFLSISLYVSFFFIFFIIVDKYNYERGIAKMKLLSEAVFYTSISLNSYYLFKGYKYEFLFFNISCIE